MADIRVQVKDEILDKLKSALHIKSNTELMEEALTILNWAAGEAQRGRMILSSESDGKDVARLAMKSLSIPLK
jgi:hypothetical protein